MKAKFNKSILVAAVMGVMFNSNTVIAEVDCEENFGPWCNIANFLEQQEPTAAGGSQFGNNPGFTGASFNSDEFGGSIIQNDETTNTLIGHLLITSNESGKATIADVTLIENPDTEQVFVQITAADKVYNLTLEQYNRTVQPTQIDGKSIIEVTANGGSVDVAIDKDTTVNIEPSLIQLSNTNSDNEKRKTSAIAVISEEVLENDIAFGTIDLGEQQRPVKGTDFYGNGFIGKPTALATINTLEGETSYRITGISNFKNITKYNEAIRNNESTDGHFRTGSITGNINVNFTNSTFSSYQEHTDKISSDITPTIRVTNGKIVDNTFLTDQGSSITVYHKNNGTRVNHTLEKGSVSGTFTGSQAQSLVGKTQVQYKNSSGITKEVNAVYSGEKFSIYDR